MIELTKLGCPEILRQNKDRWTDELMSYINDGEKPSRSVATRYNNPEIKSVIKEETHGKCAYCESRIDHVHAGDIEHIKPKSKSKYPELTFDWENLTYVCRECNRRKSDEYDESCPPINPYQEDPSDFLVAGGPFIWHKPGSEKGRLTEKLLGINRSPLWERRREKIEGLRIMLADHANETNKTIKKSLLSEIEIYIAEDREYSFCLKSAYEQLTPA